jgi:pyroglutamyl-peptidase
VAESRPSQKTPPLVVLLTGFGPFPGAPFNPTGQLVERLARKRHPALAGVRLVTHVFATSYRAVDHDLPRLIVELRPDAILMFGLAAGSRCLRVETRARNALSALIRDAEGRCSFATSIVAGGPATMAFPAPTKRLLLAARIAGTTTRLSRDAGRYLCNYLSWRAIEAAGKPGGPRLVAFVHVPKVPRSAPRRRPGKSPLLRMEKLVRGSQAILLATVAASRARRRHMTER